MSRPIDRKCVGALRLGGSLERARSLVVVSAIALFTTFACTSKKVDPRCQIIVPDAEYRGQIARHINASDLWQAYLEYLSPVKEGGRPVLSVELGFKREVTSKANEGDYDPGVVHADLLVKNLLSRRTIVAENDKFAIKDFVIGTFEKDASREEIQAAAFRATEATAMRFVLFSLDRAAIVAMRQEGPSGTSFIPVLEEKLQDQWSGDLVGEAQLALKAIRGQ